MKIIVLLILTLALGFGQINWHREVIDSSLIVYSFGMFNSLAIDTNDAPGVVYCDGAVHKIFYALKIGNLWYRETVDSNFFVAFGYSLFYDNHNTPHMSYYRVNTQTSENTHLCYAKRNTAGWQISIIDTIRYQFPSKSEMKTSLVLDTAGLPAIAFTEHDSVDSQYIKYAYFNGNSWDTSTVEHDSNPQLRDWSPSLEFDKHNRPHIVFYQNNRYISNQDTLKYYLRDSLNHWTLQWAKYLYGEGAPSLDLELVFDKYPHIAYDDGATLAYSWWDGYAWQTDYIIDIGWVGVRIRLAFDSYDHPHIVYLPDMEMAVHYCYKEDNIWYNSAIEPDTAITTPGHPDIDIKIGKNNRVYVLYCTEPYYNNYRYVKCAWRDLVGIEENHTGYRMQDTRCKLKIFPNISCGVLNIKYRLMDNGDAELAIYDVDGVRIKSIKQKNYLPGKYQQTINVSNLASGIYFLVLKQNNEQVSKKFLLIR